MLDSAWLCSRDLDWLWLDWLWVSHASFCVIAFLVLSSSPGLAATASLPVRQFLLLSRFLATCRKSLRTKCGHPPHDIRRANSAKLQRASRALDVTRSAQFLGPSSLSNRPFISFPSSPVSIHFSTLPQSLLALVSGACPSSRGDGTHQISAPFIRH